MAHEKWTAVDRYITDLRVPPDPALEAKTVGSKGCDGFAIALVAADR
jgi:hypothetical protein